MELGIELGSDVGPEVGPDVAGGVEAVMGVCGSTAPVSLDELPDEPQADPTAASAATRTVTGRTRLRHDRITGPDERAVLHRFVRDITERPSFRNAGIGFPALSCPAGTITPVTAAERTFPDADLVFSSNLRAAGKVV
ncbi:hypothetical protein AB0J52_33010 [Spirillospora sp. NPDC049652]